jgi:hypothetical protein
MPALVKTASKDAVNCPWGLGMGAAQHGDLVPQHEQLNVL